MIYTECAKSHQEKSEKPTWAQGCAAYAFPEELFVQAVTLASDTSLDENEAHPSLVLLTNWWNQEERSPYKAHLIEFFVRPSLRNNTTVYGDSEAGESTSWVWLRDSRLSQASVGDHVILTFLRSEIEIARANPGERPELQTVFGEDFGGSVFTAEELGENGDQAPTMIYALRKFPERFPGVWGDLLEQSFTEQRNVPLNVRTLGELVKRISEYPRGARISIHRGDDSGLAMTIFQTKDIGRYQLSTPKDFLTKDLTTTQVAETIMDVIIDNGEWFEDIY